MMTRPRLTLFAVAVALLASPTLAQFPGFGQPAPTPKPKRVTPPDVVRVSAHVAGFQPVAGHAFDLLVVFDLADGWHIYDPDSGDASATPTVLDLKLPAGVTAGPAVWPPPKIDKVGTLVLREHVGRFAVLVPLRVEPALVEALARRDATAPQIEVAVTYGACTEVTCLEPYTARLALPLPPATADLPADVSSLLAAAKARAATQPAAPATPTTRPAVQDGGSPELLVVLGLALLAGLILNLMPCVLPVVSIKVLSFVQQAGEDRRRILALTLAFVAGVMIVFIGFGVAVVIGRDAFGVSVGQSSLFAIPAFLVGMTIVVFALGLSLLGVYEINVPGFVSRAASGEEREGLPGAFSKGVLATLLGIPCTGPFMGAAVTYAFAQPAAIAILLWTVMGLGMTLPYLVLGLHPAWVRFIPRPGPWMVHFKQAMGFLLMGTVVWLLFALGVKGVVLGLVVVLLVLSIAAWMHGQLAPPHVAAARKWVVNSLAVGLLAAGSAYGWWLAQPEKGWIEWTPQVNQQYADQVRLVDFTASWCAICQTNKVTALDTAAVTAELQRVGGVKVLADWTTKPPAMTAEMERLAGAGISVPVTAIYPPGGGEPIVYTGPVTASQVAEAIARAAGGR